MANVTLTDTSANFDSAAMLTLANGDDVTLNNSNLTIDSDVRWGQNAAFPGNISISATLGGSVLLEGRNVWWLPFDASTGNVPSLGTVGVQDSTGGTSSATGEFLGVFTALGVAPSTAGGAMPSSGFIKFRSKVGTFQDNETVTLPGGATVTVNSATGGQRGWIHFVGEEASTATIPRLGLFQARGDWFELGTTNGADDQTFQYPVLDNCPAIQIETAPASGIYEWYLNAGSRWATATQFVPTDARGKYFGMNNATGVITIAQRASNSCGYKPASGCRVRIPNILVSNSTTAAPTTNSINATLATRWDFTTTSAGAIDIEGTCGNWYLSLASAFSVNISNSAFLQSISISNTAGETNITDCALGLNSTTEFSPVNFSNLFSGGEIVDFRAARYASSATGQFAFSATDCVGLNFTRTKGEIFGSTTAVTRGNATAYAFLFTRCNDFSMVDCSSIGSRAEFTQCARIQVSGHRYADQINGSTVATNPQYAFIVSNASTNISIDGFANFESLDNVHPHSGLISITNSYFVELKNVGTSAAPYNMGSANASGLIANSSVSANLTFRRIYTQNTRTGPFTLVNTVQNVTCVNVWGDGADAQAIPALNITPQGCRWTNSVTGQSSVYGRHWEDAFTSTTAGRILISCNEPLADTADQAEITSGTPAFTSAGQIAMRTLGDQVVWTMPYFCLGYTSLANIAPTITGTNTGNFTLEYQIDTGSGFGSWKTLNATNLSGETISPSTGFKLKVRATVAVASSTNALTYIRIDGVTNSTDQQTQYALPFDASGTIAGIVSGSRLQIYNVTTDAEIVNTIVSGTSYNHEYYNGVGISAGDVVRLRLAYVSGVTAKLPQEIITVATATGFAALAGQVDDTVYATNAINGSAVTELAADYPNIHIDSNDADGETTVQRIYAWFVYNQFTSSGIAQFFNALVAEDLVNYRIDSALADLKFDNVIATPLMIIGGRIYRDDGETVIASTSNSIQLDPNKAYAVEVGTSGLTPTESATLAILDTLTEDVSGLRFTSKALEEAPAGGGGGGATAADVWSYATRTLTASSDPSASTIASAVRTELSTELGRIDATVSSRLSSAGYTTPPTAASIRSEIDANSTKLDVAVSTRLATAGYTAPDNASVTAIKAKTDNLPAAPASEGNVSAVGAAVTALGDPLQDADYVAPDNASIEAIKGKTDLIPGLF